MLLNYLKVTGRNFVKQRLYSAVNVLGLAAGFTCCLLIALYVLDESSYDQQHPDADRIYRFSQTYVALDEPLYLGTAAPQVGPLLKENFTEVEDFTRLFLTVRVFASQDGSFHDEEVMLADPSVFDFVALDWVQGDPTTALAEPDNVVVTRSFAREYFGSEDVYGQSLLMGNKSETPLRVTGIVEDLPPNMHFVTGAFLALSSLPATSSRPTILQDWDFPNIATYLKLKPQADSRQLQDAFGTFILQSMPERMRTEWKFSSLKLPDIHLHSPLQGLGERSSGNLTNIRILSVIGAGLLLLACINFVNLSTARALQRSKEVVIRKAIGSSRNQLFQQFMGESLLLVLIAFLAALAFAELLLPVLNAFTGKSMTIAVLFASAPAALSVIGTVLLVAFLAGCYPALYLSALRPAQRALQVTDRRHGLAFRDVLVVFQFSLSIMLVIATLVVNSQVQLGKTMDLGFNKEQLLGISTPDSGVFGNAWWPTLKNELMTQPGIVAATISGTRPFATKAVTSPSRWSNSRLSTISSRPIR
ncbi:MAG: ABC transporter permease [Pseudomonadota bacterium]